MDSIPNITTAGNTPATLTATIPAHLRAARDQPGTLAEMFGAISVFLSMPDFARHDFREEAWERSLDLCLSHRQEVAR